jgi:hypothetical protein
MNPDNTFLREDLRKKVKIHKPKVIIMRKPNKHDLEHNISTRSSSPDSSRSTSPLSSRSTSPLSSRSTSPLSSRSSSPLSSRSTSPLSSRSTSPLSSRSSSPDSSRSSSPDSSSTIITSSTSTISPTTTIKTKSITKPIDNIDYVYPIQSILLDKLEEPIKINTKLHLCCYRINDTLNYPFLEYLLYKFPQNKNETIERNKKYNELLILPTTKYKDNTKTIQQTIENGILKYINSDFSLFQYKGIHIFNGDIFVFYSMNFTKNIVKINRKDNWIWTLIDEIINTQSVLNFNIYNLIYDLFTNNPVFLYLKTTNTYYIDYYKTDIIEIPTVLYHGTYYTLTDKVALLGLNKCDLNCMMGNYYYFGTYRKSIRYAGWTSTYKPRTITNDDGTTTTIGDHEGRYSKGGIIRFAVFLGNMKVLLNHPDDTDDKSSLYFERITNIKNKVYEDRVLKLHDHDGNWYNTENYDSIYVGQAKLNNGKIYMKNPEFIVGSSNNFTSLTYHYFDKSTLLKNWNNNYNYYYIE